MTLQDSRLPSRRGVLRGAFLAALCLVTVGAALSLGADRVGAHGNPEVNVKPNPAAFGGEVTIEGEGFEEGSEISLVLEGVLGEVSLGSVTADSEGIFSITLALPSSAAPGSYRVRAAGADDLAVFDMRIQEEAGGTTPPAAHGAAVGFHSVDSAAEIAGFAVLAAVLVLIGAVLVWLPWSKSHA